MPSSSAALSRRHHPNLALDQQLCFALYSATHAIMRSYKRALVRVGLTYPQYLVLLVLWERDGSRISDLAGALHLDAATVTPLVQRLEAGGWVKRLRVPGDDRMVSVTLQPQGWAARDRVSEVQKAMACQTGLRPAEFDRLKAELLQMADRMNSTLDTRVSSTSSMRAMPSEELARDPPSTVRSSVSSST